MPWVRDSLETVVGRIKNDIEVTTGFDAHSQGSVYTHLAHVFGAVCHSMYGMIEYYGKQISDDDKDDDVLIAEAATYGIYRVSAAFAIGSITVAGTVGATISAGTQFKTSDGQYYTVDADHMMDTTSTDVAVTAVAAGVTGNQDAGTTLHLLSAVPGIANTATVTAAGIKAGADIEEMSRLRARLWERKVNPPQGGCDFDYIRWAKAAHSDVTRAWVYAHEDGIGSVTVRFVTEDLADSIPTPAHVTAVSNYINQLEVRPAGMRALTIEAPTAAPLNLVFTSLTPATAEVKLAIENEIKDWLRRKARPGVTLFLHQMEQAIRAGGAEDFDIGLTADITHTITEFPVLGVTTWP